MSASHVNHAADEQFGDMPLGLRLRRAREASGMSLSAAAEALHLPVLVVEAMEREDVERLGAAIYVRGNYSSYARLLGVPGHFVESFCRGRATQPQVLAPSTHVPLARILFDRYVKRSVYIVLTASIVPSVIWLASLDRSSAPVQTLLESSKPATPLSLPGSDAATAGNPSGLGAAETESDVTPLQAVRASMTPSYEAAPHTSVPAELVTPPAALDAATAPVAQLELTFVEDSWFEVIGTNGHRLDSGIARAGEQRQFNRGAVGRVSLGNAGGVEVRLDDQSLDLTPYRRANVARFALSSAGSVLPSEG